ncbi:MAG: MATE family efflux transporter [Butyricicoccus sp.]|nr:MATE family efflux transporter [Butyricicoccus sp.]
MKDMTKGSPTKLLFTFALPVLIGHLFQLLYNMTDTRIVGAYLGETALAAVGATGSLNNLAIGFLLNLANGMAIITARFFGAHEYEKVRKSVSCTLVLGVSTAAVLTLLSVIFLDPMLQLLNTPEHLHEMAAGYFRIILLGMVITILYNSCAAVLRAIGNTVVPLIFLIVSVILNIGLDLLFVCVFQWGVEGAAIATVLAQLASVALSVLYIAAKYPLLHPKKSDFHLEFPMASQMYISGMCMGFMLSLVNLGSVILQGAINSFGDDIIVAHTAARRLTELLMKPFSVLGTAMSTYASQNFGAGRYDRIRLGLHRALLLGLGGCALAVAASYTFVPAIISWLTGGASQEIIDTASRYLRVDTLFYFITMVIVMYRNTLQSIGDHVTPIISSLCETFGKIGAVVLLIPPLGYFGVILTEPIVWAIMVIPLIIRLHRHPVMRKDNMATEAE